MMSQDLDGSASGSIWVWLNTDNPVMNALIEKTASETSLLWLKIFEARFHTTVT